MSSFPKALQADQVTILAYGGLLSESSSRLTFPNLQEFRHVRIRHYRRVFGHPHLFLMAQGLADPSNTKCLASLSAEPEQDASFVAAAFTVQLDDQQRADFVARETGYEIVSVPYYDLLTADGPDAEPLGTGVICLASQDAKLPDHVSIPPNVPSIWHWPRDSGLLPANIYLRHCLLAVEKAGDAARDSFWQDTYLADRETNLAKYLETNHDRVMACRPPPALATRFGG